MLRASARAKSIPIVLLAGVAAVLFAPLFRWGLAKPALFWWWMSGLLLLLNTSMLVSRPDLHRQLVSDFRSDAFRKLVIGIVSAAGLYLIFLAGRMLIRGWLPDSEQHISSVYLLRPALSAWLIALLMITIIGPGEEIFWRLFLQPRFCARFGDRTGLLIGALLYAGVHAGSGNLVLILAALVAGLFWGWLYATTSSASIIIYSHALWDVSVFVIAPFS